MSKKTYNGILKDNTKEQNYIHPQTNSRQVLTGENNNSNLQEELNAINDKFAQIKENETNKGAFASHNALVSKWEEKIANPLDRAGWTAIVEDEDKLYFYDTQENMWKPTSSGGGTGSGIQSVNAKTDKNIVLTGSDINSTIDDNNTKTITEHLQDIKNISSDGSIVANQAKEKAQYLEEQIQALLSNPNSVFTINEKATYTFFNNNTLKNGIYLLKAGADVYYGHEGYSGSSNYKLKLYSGAILIVQRTNDWGSLGGFGSTTFQAIDSSEIYTGITNHYNSSCNKLPMPQKFTNEGFSTQNFIAKIIDANGTMQWIAPDYYTKSQTYTKQQIEELVENAGGTGGGTTITDTLTLSKEVFVPEVPAIDPLIINVENISTAETPYGFELNANGYYESNNKGVSLSWALCKVTFTLPTTTNVVFDVINYGENNYDFGIFSTIDNYLSDDYKIDTEPTKVEMSFKSESSSTIKTLTYNNVEAGTHFITIKYRKDGSGDQGYDSLQFRLNEEMLQGKPGIPSYTYTSSSSIKIDDYNTLQIDGKNILKDGDVKEPIKELIGTQENPIVLWDLEYGLYSLGGYFKLLEVDGAAVHCFKLTSGADAPITTFNVSVGANTNRTMPEGKYICIKDCFKSGSQTIATKGTGETLTKNGNNSIIIEMPNNTMTSYNVTRNNYNNFLTAYNGTKSNTTALVTNNTFAYEPEAPNNPATKGYVDKSLIAHEPIRVIENPQNYNDIDLINKFATNKDYNDTNLYFFKKTGERVEEEPANAQIQYEDIYLSKNVLDYHTTQNLLSINIGIYSKKDGSILFYQSLQTHFTNGDITKITFAGKVIYWVDDTGWSGLGDLGDKISLISVYNAGMEETNSNFAGKLLLDTLGAFPDYFKVINTYPISTPIKIGGNGGSSSGSSISDIELSLDTSTYELSAKLLDNDGNVVGTQKTVDLPLESVVVNASYNNSTKEITLTLNNGNTTSFSVADLVSGLVPNNRAINGKSLTENVELTGKDILLGNEQIGSITTHIETLEEIIGGLEENLEIVFEQQFSKIIYVTVTGYDGDDNDISFRIPAVVGLVQTYYYDNQYYSGEIKVRITGMGTNNATIVVMSTPNGVTINTTGGYVKLKDL